MSPTVAVVVATHNRRHLWPRLLASLAAQEEPPPFEVVVVDDASTDDTAEWLTAQAASLPFELTVLRQERNQGPAAARNRGWRTTAAPVVCFTDDDCVPTATWLSRLVGSLDGADIVQGHTEPNPDQEDRRGPFSRSIMVRLEEGFYETCNIAYRRGVLEQIDGFDERFRFPFGEDTDLAWRAKEAGFTSTFADDAIVYHEIWPSDFRATLRESRRLQGMVFTLQKHPELRDRLGYPVFLRRGHREALGPMAAGLLFLARRSRLAAAVVVIAILRYAWMVRRLRPHPPHRRQWLFVVPRAFVIDVYELAVLSRASLRYRTLLL